MELTSLVYEYPLLCLSTADANQFKDKSFMTGCCQSGFVRSVSRPSMLSTDTIAGSVCWRGIKIAESAQRGKFIRSSWDIKSITQPDTVRRLRARTFTRRPHLLSDIVHTSVATWTTLQSLPSQLVPDTHTSPKHPKLVYCLRLNQVNCPHQGHIAPVVHFSLCGRVLVLVNAGVPDDEADRPR
jgi:hypothetical protein